MTDCSYATAAKFIFEEIICQFGCPSKILTNRGTHFDSNLVKDLLNLMEIKHVMSSAYHPQTNGMTERFNGTLCSCLAKLANQDKNDWDCYLPQVLYYYRIREHNSTKQSPYKLLYGINSKPEWLNAMPHLVELNETQDFSLRDSVRTTDNNRVHRQPKGSKKIRFAVGDLVWMRRAPNSVTKLEPLYSEPYRVAPYNTYGLVDDHGRAFSYWIHVSKLKKFDSRNENIRTNASQWGGNVA